MPPGRALVPRLHLSWAHLRPHRAISCRRARPLPRRRLLEPERHLGWVPRPCEGAPRGHLKLGQPERHSVGRVQGRGVPAGQRGRRRVTPQPLEQRPTTALGSRDGRGHGEGATMSYPPFAACNRPSAIFRRNFSGCRGVRGSVRQRLSGGERRGEQAVTCPSSAGTMSGLPECLHRHTSLAPIVRCYSRRGAAAPSPCAYKAE